MQVADIRDDIDYELISHEDLMKRIREVAKQVSEDYKNRNILLVAVLKGAVNTLAVFSQELSVNAPMDFMSLSSYGSGTQTSGHVKVREDLSTDVRGKDILIVEDIVDSGRTLDWLVNELKGRGANSVKVFALLSKPARREVDVKIDYTGFEIPDAFVVGFGMDYDERYRNLNSIAVLKPSVYGD